MKNWWTSKPYWMKGGMLGVIFIIIYTPLFGQVAQLLYPGNNETLLQILSTPATLPFTLLGTIGWILGITEKATFNFPSLIITAFALYFFIGAIIGWTIEKIKK